MPLSVNPDPDSVAKVQGGGYIVKSRSLSEGGEAAFRLVWGNECSCPATGPSCRHRKMVAAYVAAEDRARRPQAVPVNVSAMVD